MEKVLIRKFENKDQLDARSIILTGFKEHFGYIDSKANPDLENIANFYSDKYAQFYVAEIQGVIVGTGALKVRGDVGEIVRISVLKDWRKKGIGKKLVQSLLDVAKEMKLKQVVVATEHDWVPAIRLYESLGFTEFKKDNVDTYFQFSF